MTGNRLNFLGEIRARKLPGLVVNFSEAQQGKVFEKIAKQSSRGWLRGKGGAARSCFKFRFTGEFSIKMDLGLGGAAIFRGILVLWLGR